MGANLAGLAKHLVLPFFDVYDGELMMGHERGHLKVYQNAKMKELSHEMAWEIKCTKPGKFWSFNPCALP